MLRAAKHFFLCLAVFGSSAFGQTARFDVASIRPSDPGAQNSSLMFGAGGVFTGRSLAANALIAFAFDVRDFQLSGGPGWLSGDRFDIVARPEQPVSGGSATARDQRSRECVLSLLKERFGLAAHKEMREREVYALRIAKGGPKLRAVTTAGDRQGITDGRARLQGFATTTSLLAKILSGTMGRTVVDETGLTGLYDFVLEWTPESMLPSTGAQSPGTGPSIFTAMQEQLGLKLDSVKAPDETIVIDHIDRPSEN